MLRTNNIFISIYLTLITFHFTNSSLKFQIQSNREKCFQQEIYMGSTLMVHYDLTGFEPYFIGESQTELFKNIKIFIRNDKGKNIYETSLKSRKNKFATYIDGNGFFQICTRYYKPYREKELPKQVMMGLKIRNDYLYKELDQSLLKEDIKGFWKRIRHIKEDIFSSLQAERAEIEEEDKIAKSIISSINTYYSLCLIQLFIIIFIVVITLYNFKSFFKGKSII